MDSSALIAILYSESEGVDFQTKVAQAPQPMMSTANYLEAAVVSGASGRQDGSLLSVWQDLDPAPV